jgi:predicted metal-dependent enzyme (double-stranded beta helix superfamily)
MTRSLATLADLVAAVRQAIDVRTEHEELFDEALNPMGTQDNPPGEVSGFAPPGDIHRIRNIGDETAISLHIYGTDITRVGSSARRFYN